MPSKHYDFFRRLHRSHLARRKPGELPVQAPTKYELVINLKTAQGALQMPAVQERLAALGVEPMPLSLEQFDKYFRDDVEANVSLVSRPLAI
jgi:hypothetical protein